MHGKGGNVVLGHHEMVPVSDFGPQEDGRREGRQSRQDQGEIVLVPAFPPRNKNLWKKICFRPFGVELKRQVISNGKLH